MRFSMLVLATIIHEAILLNITCEYRKVKWKFINDHYQCQVADLNVQAIEVVEGINGEHLPEHSFNDVKSISIEGQVCHYMPKDLDTFFTNIEGLQIMSSKLEAITLDDLRKFPKLKVLNLYKNELTSISADLFLFTPRLQWINFNDNKIQSIDPQIFGQIEDLEEIRFDDNSCIASEGTGSEEINKLKQEIIAKCHLSP